MILATGVNFILCHEQKKGAFAPFNSEVDLIFDNANLQIEDLFHLIDHC